MESDSDRLFQKQVIDSGAVQIGGESPQTIEEARTWYSNPDPRFAIVGLVALLILSQRV